MVDTVRKYTKMEIIMTRLITQAGLKKLQEELHERTGTIRQEIAGAIKEAKEQGDLSENAEYATAKQRQNENETRIAELEALIKEAEVVSSTGTSTVSLGSTVRVKSERGETTFEIVSPNEVDPAKFRISHESPIGKALLGKSTGDKVVVGTPRGSVSYEILEVL